MVTCGLCGNAFEEDRSQPACRSCPLGAGCGLVRCPSCGYENPREPDWLGKLRGWFRSEEEEGEGVPSVVDATRRGGESP
jgi:hypothetical protein